MEELVISVGDKREKYEMLLPQVKAVIDPMADTIANMANVAAMLKDTFNFWWVGFYRVIDCQLVLGPFQGPMACTRIAYGRGVCGTAWEQSQTLVVPNVNLFPGHIACSSASQSEIVVPLFSSTADGSKSEVVAVLDIDSAQLSAFDETDANYLERICALITS